MALTDRALTAGQIWKLLDLLESDVLSRHQVRTFTLPVSGWEVKSQTLSDEFFAAQEKYHYLVCSDADCQLVYSDNGLMALNITTDGQIVFQCEHVPEVDLTINIIRLEVEV